MNKNYIVKKIKDLPLFQGAPTGSELIAFQDPATGITYKVEQNKIGGGGGGTTDHQGLTLESRNATGAHPNIEASVVTVNNASIARDASLQNQIFAMQENNPVAQTRYLTRDQVVLNAETLYQSKAEKDGNPTFEITANITATTAETANLVASWVGVALVNELELIDQITQLFIKARKNATNRNVVMFARFFDRTSGGIKTLKGTSSQVVLTNATTSYDLYFPIQAYLAAVGSRGQIDILGFQTGAGAAAQITTVIEGDYYSRWSYTTPAGSLSFLDEKLISSQDLPSLNLLSGVTQKQVNAAQNTLNAALKQFSLQVEISGRDRFTQLFGRACNITEVLKDAGITNILVSKNGGANVNLLTSLPYAVAKSDKLEFTLTYDQLTRVALTLNCTRL